MKILPFYLSLSFTCLSSFLLWQASPPVQAQTLTPRVGNQRVENKGFRNQSDITGAIVTTGDGAGGIFTQRGPGGRVRFSSPAVRTQVNKAAVNILNKLNTQTLTSPAGNRIPGQTQQRLLTVLTTPKSAPAQASVQQLTNALSRGQGAPTASQAQQLATSLQGLFKPPSTNATASGNVNATSPVRVSANQLQGAINAYNGLVNNSSAQFLQNPPPALIGARAVLVDLISGF